MVDDEGKPIDFKKIKIVIDPEALAQLEAEMTLPEVQQFLDDLKAQVESGELFENSEPIDWETLEREDPAAYAQLRAQIGHLPIEPTLN